MAKTVARNASFYVDDSTGASRAMSGLMNNITISYTAEAPEVTSFGEDNRTRLHNGIKDYEVTFEAFFSTGANEVDAVMSSILGGSTFFKFGPTGSTSTCVLYSASAVCTNYEMTFGVEDAATVSGTLVNRAGSMTRGTW